MTDDVTQLALAQAGANAWNLFSDSDKETIFKTIASACSNDAERALYLATCKAHGLSPLKGELHATRRREKQLDGSYISKLILVTSYHVFVSRARQSGWIPSGASVCAKDDWGGWDAVASLPSRHVMAAGDRGNVMGAWASCLHIKTGARIGMFWPWEELAQLYPSGDPAPMWAKMPSHMSFKTAIERVTRLACPDLACLFGAEEMGVEIPEDPTKLAELPATPTIERLAAETASPPATAALSPSRRKKMVDAFAKLNVHPGQIARRLGHSLESISEDEFTRLQEDYRRVLNGESFSKIIDEQEAPPLPLRLTTSEKIEMALMENSDASRNLDAVLADYKESGKIESWKFLPEDVLAKCLAEYERQSQVPA